jgi:hypothetical protein
MFLAAWSMPALFMEAASASLQSIKAFGSGERQPPKDGAVLNMTTTSTKHNMQATKTTKANQPICIHTFKKSPDIEPTNQHMIQNKNQPR